VAGQVPVPFGALLRRLRSEAGLTQEALAEAAQVSLRTVSDLERGVNSTARRDTARLIADALNLIGPARAAFEAAALGRPAGGGSGGSVVAAATRTLPRDVASFTGRSSELRELADAAEAASTGCVVGIHAIGGMAGIGKTAFAVHAAHQLAPRFRDGQIFLPLHGHTPGQRPVDPADALASLLLTAGVPAAQIPPGLEARTALWRDRLAGKQLLMVLDDAAGSEQVQPLLPGTPGSLVLVTSRRHLTALEDARAISLDTLPAWEAAGLLVRLAGRPGLAASDPVIGEITRLCGYLPLAIGMLARQLHHHPAWTASGLAADLAAARDRLELLTTENLSAAAAFDLSYQDLTHDQQRTFRRLGLHPGTDIDACTTAALDGTDLATARRGLAALYDQYLLAEPARGRYRCHDLLRAHAQALAATDPAAENAAAGQRLLDYYLHTARLAGRYLARRTPGELPPAASSPQAPGFSTRRQALTWLDAERPNLHATIRHAAAGGQTSHAAAIAAAIHGYLRSQGHWDQALTLHRATLDAARRAGDRRAEASALTDLGDVEDLTGDYPAATASLTRAADMHRELGDRRGEAAALAELAVVQRLTGDYQAASASLGTALELYRDAADGLGEAYALTYLGVVQYLVREYPAATASLSKALGLHRAAGDEQGEASTLNYLGAVQQVSDDYQAAAASQQRALELCRELGDRFGEANALNHLGIVQYLTGEYEAASASLGHGLAVCRDLGYRLGEALCVTELGVVQYLTGEHAAAIASARDALALCRTLGNRLGEANALTNLGLASLAAGDHAAAGGYMADGLALFRDLSDRAGEAEASNALGELMLAEGDPAGARTHHERALALATGIPSRLEEARALEGIGRCLLREGQPGAGRLREALAIYQRIRSPRAGRVEPVLRACGL
jgi:tetratricopeptide (TPR) repeat protein/transcriptional regulator with XRE-family HTH domain